MSSFLCTFSDSPTHWGTALPPQPTSHLCPLTKAFLLTPRLHQEPQTHMCKGGSCWGGWWVSWGCREPRGHPRIQLPPSCKQQWPSGTRPTRPCPASQSSIWGPKNQNNISTQTWTSITLDQDLVHDTDYQVGLPLPTRRGKDAHSQDLGDSWVGMSFHCWLTALSFTEPKLATPSSICTHHTLLSFLHVSQAKCPGP